MYVHVCTKHEHICTQTFGNTTVDHRIHVYIYDMYACVHLCIHTLSDITVDNLGRVKLLDDGTLVSEHSVKRDLI